MKKTIFILVSILLPFAIYSQDVPKPCKLKGTVLDSLAQKAVPYTTISVYQLPAHQLLKKLAAGADGKFVVELKASGSFELLTQMVGYKAARKGFAIKENDKTLDLGTIVLREQTEAINEVQIIADKPLVKVDAEKITYNTEQDPDAKSSNAIDIMRKVPLLTVDGEDNLQLKGSSSFKIFINGKPSNILTRNPKDVLKSMPANMIKNIEVITSPGAKYDAEGIGGIINIVTQKNSMRGFTSNLNLGANTNGANNANVYVAGMAGKLSFSTNLSISAYRNPSMNSSSSSEDYLHPNTMFKNAQGASNSNGFSGYGSGELSYEIDSLSLITASFNAWGGKSNSGGLQRNLVQDSERIDTMKFELENSNHSQNRGPQANLDFQHTFKRNKEQSLTLSYNTSYNSNTSNGLNSVNNILNYPYPNQDNINWSSNREQTVQADYVHPFSHNCRLELGSKYIYRKSESQSEYNIQNLTTNEFVLDRASRFGYTQKIFSAYTSLSYKYKKNNIRVGLRLESTQTHGEVFESVETVFENKGTDLVPNINISRQLKPNQTIRLSYNLRLQRPGIWYLNPYINKTDPLNIYHGNPDLKSEQFHNAELNYSIFGRLANISLSTSYMYSGNSIDRVSTPMPGGVMSTTYENIAVSQTWNNSLFGSLRFNEKLMLSLNTSIALRKLSSAMSNSFKVNGWNYNVSGNIQYTVIKNLRLSGFGGLFKTPMRLQSSSAVYYYSGLSLSSDFFKGMMNASVSCQNVFWNTMTLTNESRTEFYYTKSSYDRLGRSFNFNLSFRFGRMNAQVKKAQRGIKNDDVKSGE